MATRPPHANSTAPAKQSVANGPASGGRLLAVAAIFAAALALYVWTLAPTVTLVDSGELIVAAQSLGVAHPPGFPLYVMLAHAATWLPFGNAAQRVGFASALFAALAVVLLFAAVDVACNALASRPLKGRRVRFPPFKKGGQGGFSESPSEKSPSIPLFQRGRSEEINFVCSAGPGLLGPLVAALLFAGSRTLWSYATIAEVYTLNTMLLLLVFVLMLRWRSGQTARNGDDRWLYAAAFVFGLALGVHHVTVALTLPGLAAFVAGSVGMGFFKSRRLPLAFLCACAGLLVYAYLPLAAARDPVLSWGDPRTLQRLWWHVSGRQYQSYFSFSPGEMGGEAIDFVRRMLREWGPWWCPAGLALSVAGLVELWRRDRSLFAFLVLVVVANVAYGLSYVIAEDKDAYNLPAWAAMTVAAGIGAAWLQSWVQLSAAQRLRLPRPQLAVAVVLLLLPLIALAGNFRFNDRSRYFIAHDYASNILQTISPGGLLLTLDWQVCAPLLYTRLSEQVRRDVVVIDVNLMRRSWYFTYLRRQYPEVMARVRGKVDAFLEDLRSWEQDPAAYARSPMLTQRIDSRFYDMLLVLLRGYQGPVYITQDIALGRDPENARLSQSLVTTYQLVPQGLVFEIFADQDFHEPKIARLETRGLADGTLSFEANDVVKLKVLPVYVSMLHNRGRYLALHAHHRDAIAAFREALALDPGFVAAQRALAESTAKLP